MQVENEIVLDYRNEASFKGPLASPYAYRPELRQVVTDLWKAACRSTNRAFVLEGSTVRAAQSKRDNALAYMEPDRVLVTVDFPEVTDAMLAEAKRCWAYFPYRSCWIALKEGEEPAIVLKATAHVAGQLAREGWFVVKLERA